MPNPKDTITNRLQRALLGIVESTEATAQQRLDASEIILKIRELAKSRDRTSPRKSSKLVRQYRNVLGTR